MAIGKAIEAADNLSDTTKQVYQERLAKMQSELKLPPNRLVRQPIKTLDWIKQHSDSLQTQKSYLAAILALFKYVPKLKEKEARKYTLFSNAFQDIQNQLDAQANQSTHPKANTCPHLLVWDHCRPRQTKTLRPAATCHVHLYSSFAQRLWPSLYLYIPPVPTHPPQLHPAQRPNPQTRPPSIQNRKKHGSSDQPTPTRTRHRNKKQPARRATRLAVHQPIPQALWQPRQFHPLGQPHPAHHLR